MFCGVGGRSVSHDSGDAYRLFCDEKGRRIRVSADCWISGNALELPVPAEAEIDCAELRISGSIADIVGKVG
ncbi:UNVERIFIED_CONTAM: hypothetical protein PYX00_004520 [Menopon gallinae]|uniref:Uncharacterized protein n=1 Tax=Menopon gallinae TaxID=328185 RepID=A0AAW2I5T5_9NEOP